MTTVSVSGGKRQTAAAAAAAATQDDRCGIKTPACAGRAPYNEARLASYLLHYFCVSVQRSALTISERAHRAVNSVKTHRAVYIIARLARAHHAL